MTYNGTKVVVVGVNQLVVYKVGLHYLLYQVGLMKVSPFLGQVQRQHRNNEKKLGTSEKNFPKQLHQALYRLPHMLCEMD